ncbi:hypothetical protein K3495_g14737, partial [Podosphaera aphanis]
NPYSSDLWYGEIFKYLSYGYREREMDRLQLRTFLRKCSNYQIQNSVLFFICKKKKKRCVLQNEVSGVLTMAHDRGGHWSTEQTLKHLRDYYWPKMTIDVRDYILGCLRCAKHGIQGRKMTQSSARVTAPFVLFGMDFIGPLPDIDIDIYEARARLWPHLIDIHAQFGSTYGPFYENYQFEPGQPSQPKTKFKLTHILVVIDYFSRFVWAFPCTEASSGEFIRCLNWLFNYLSAPVAVYSDNQPFSSKEVTNFLEQMGSLFIPAPVGAHRAVGMVEKHNDLVERILKKGYGIWPFELQDAVKSLNSRVIHNLGYTPHEVLYGFQPIRPLEYTFPTASLIEMRKKVQSLNVIDSTEDTCFAQLNFISERHLLRDQVVENDDWRRKVQIDRHNSGVNGVPKFYPGSLVMLYDEAQAKRKLRASYRGPFVITGYGGDHKKSFILRQINGRPIYRTFHGDQLKLFRPRGGYLIPSHEETHPGYQNIRGKTTYSKLPKNIR